MGLAPHSATHGLFAESSLAVFSISRNRRAGDEFLQRAGHRGLLGPFATYRHGAFDQIGIQGKIGSRV